MIATNYMMKAKVKSDKKNNEVFRGLASDVVCTIADSIFGQQVDEM